MAYVSDELYNDICMSNDIVDYASSFLTLKKSGRSYMACCPFHNEKTPSFHIDRDKQLFHCFGCGASGNFVQFVMRMEGLDYRDAIQLLAERAGIEIPETGIKQSSEISKKKDIIIEMNRITARYFYDCLMNPELGKKARAYFGSRRLSRKTIIMFGLGYAPDSFDSLVKFLKQKGYNDDQIISAGLAVKRNDKVFDKFRDRVMFPIINARGKVIGFGGRVLGSEVRDGGFKLAKYLNTPETPVFDKGGNLFALNLAKNANETDIILCEGYMDVITLHQAGITNTVATLGTAITQSQAKLMLRYGREILICYDMDEAGTKAALRAIDIISSVGGRSRVIRISGAKDPDEFITKYGVAGFKKAIEKAIPSTEFKISIVKKQYDVTDTDGKIKFVEEVSGILAALSDPVEIEAYIKKTSLETGITEQSIFGKYKESRDNQKKQYPSRTKEEYKRREINRINNQKPPEERVTNVVIEAEKRVLSLISQSRHLCLLASKIMSYDEFSNEIYKTLARKIYEYTKKGEQVDASAILNEFSGDANAENTAAAVFFNEEEYGDNAETMFDLIYTIKLNRIEAKINTATDPIEIGQLIELENRLSEEREEWGKVSDRQTEGPNI